MPIAGSSSITARHVRPFRLRRLHRDQVHGTRHRRGRSHHLRHRGDLDRAARGARAARCGVRRCGRFRAARRPPSAAARAGRHARQCAVRTRKRRRSRQGPVPAGRPAGAPAGRRLPVRQCAADARLAALGLALGSYRSTVTARARTRRSGWSCRRASTARDSRASSRRRARARPHQHAGQDMGPAELEDAAEAVATRARRALRVIVGDALLARELSRSSMRSAAPAPRAPRLVDMIWGDERAPKLTLVGKGVCFDTGGLDLKTARGMRMMKKDMGGAATLLALAAGGDGAESAGAAARAGAGGREFGRRQRLPPARRFPHAQGHHGRDRQHRCRRPAHPLRRAGRGLPRERRR